MKMNDIKASNYSYHSFFDYMTDKLEIAVLPHNLHNDIAGLSIKDKHGHSSISYQSTHHLHRQNFTKCHELGHFLLEHEGNVFTSSKDTNSLIEIEANIFAGQLLAPDIVLYGKIVKDNLYFQELVKDLEISPEALSLRLSDLLSYQSNLTDNEIKVVIQDYLTRKNTDLLDALQHIEQKIITSYQLVKINPLEQLEELLQTNPIVTSTQIPELANPIFRDQLPNHLFTGFQWGRGVTLHYCWNSQKTHQTQAEKLGKSAWYLEAY